MWQRHGHQLLGPLPASHLPSASRATQGRGVEPGVSPLLGSTALIHSRRESLRSTAVSVPGCAWPTEHTVVWPAQGRDSHHHAQPRDATHTHTRDSNPPLAQSVPRMRSAAEAGNRKSGRAPGTVPEPSLQAFVTCSLAPSRFTYKMKTQR